MSCRRGPRLKPAVRRPRAFSNKKGKSMRLWLVSVLVVVGFCLPSLVDAQTNPLWSEQRVKNFLPHMTWPEVRDLLSRTDMVLIPIPALEQHGFQGPIGTDYYSGVEQWNLIAPRTDSL